MARRKIQEEAELQTDVMNQDPEDMVQEQENTAGEQTAEGQPTAEKVAEEQGIPDYADQLLKVFSNVPEMYISTKGRFYSVDTKPAIRGNAILYKNPYYNN